MAEGGKGGYTFSARHCAERRQAPSARPPRNWAQCQHCEKWRRVVVLLGAEDRFRCIDCSAQEDVLSSDEEDLSPEAHDPSLAAQKKDAAPEQDPAPQGAATRKPQVFSFELSSQSTRTASCPPQQTHPPPLQDSRDQVLPASHTGLSAPASVGRGRNSDAAVAAKPALHAPAPQTAGAQTTRAPPPGDPESGSVQCQVAGARHGAAAVTVPSGLQDVEAEGRMWGMWMPGEVFWVLSEFLEPAEICRLAGASRGWRASCAAPAVWRAKYFERWGETTAARARVGVFTEDDGDDSASEGFDEDAPPSAHGANAASATSRRGGEEAW
ncbi:hypothetical protein T484DRAFT_1919823, partial [Baffinella frigidus]